LVYAHTYISHISNFEVEFYITQSLIVLGYPNKILVYFGTHCGRMEKNLKRVLLKSIYNFHF